MRLALAFLILTGLTPLSANSEVLVVVNQNSSVESLTKSEVVDIFMGRFSTFPNGEKVKVFDLAPKSKLKSEFYAKLVNRTEAQIDAYWARLLFSGRSSPPEKTNSSAQLINELLSTSHGIGYISSQDLTDRLKVVYRFEAF
ncbi:hypothetical protein [Shewanella sp. UCD-KL12]|uniref:hypothetical protein n=1 Tax=Shewanella sp. UCD-KL12 TaxID=1917163 RepID=UPI000970FBFE|nr:hypothetical protein [Shewanella sp. UCD-KL12]